MPFCWEFRRFAFDGQWSLRDDDKSRENRRAEGTVVCRPNSSSMLPLETHNPALQRNRHSRRPIIDVELIVDVVEVGFDLLVSPR